MLNNKDNMLSNFAVVQSILLKPTMPFSGKILESFRITCYDHCPLP